MARGARAPPSSSDHEDGGEQRGAVLSRSLHQPHARLRRRKPADQLIPAPKTGHIWRTVALIAKRTSCPPRSPVLKIGCRIHAGAAPTKRKPGFIEEITRQSTELSSVVTTESLRSSGCPAPPPSLPERTATPVRTIRPPRARKPGSDRSRARRKNHPAEIPPAATSPPPPPAPSTARKLFQHHRAITDPPDIAFARQMLHRRPVRHRL